MGYNARFAEDPYDAVRSFGVQLAGLAALLSLVRGEPAEDLLDDLACFYVWAEAHVPGARGLFGRLERLAEFFWAQVLIRALNPRKHPWRLAALAAAGTGSARLMAEVVAEGVPR